MSKKLIKHGNRVQCIGDGCEVMVLNGQGECRDCRRARIRAGKKRMAKNRKGNSLFAKVLRAFETAKRQFDRVKNIRWARPKRTIRGLYIKERRRAFTPVDPEAAMALLALMNADKKGDKQP